MALSQKHPEPEPTVINTDKLSPEKRENWKELLGKIRKAKRGEGTWHELE